MKHKKILVLLLISTMLTGFVAGCQSKKEVIKERSAEAQKNVTMEGQSLNLSGVVNARELGGYVAEDGRTVKKGILLRSGKLASGTEGDIQILRDTYNLGTVVDFRTSDEIASSPDPDIQSVANVQIRILDESDSSTNHSVTGIYGADPVTDMIKLVENGTLSDDMYVGTAFSQTAQDGYREFFDLLLNNTEGKSVLWHCTGGKDRAGVASVLVLSALGVDEETILSDFELTNAFNAERIQYMAAEAEKKTKDKTIIEGVKTLTGVSRGFMKKMIDELKLKYGSVQNYLIEEIGLSQRHIQTLKDMYLE